MLRLVTRAQWGARTPDYRNLGDLSDESTCHWNGPTVTVGGQTTWDHSKCASLVRGIQNFHMDTQGWSDIAYNFLECPHGYTFEGRGFNVINGANGTTTGNRTSHAICCLAGEANPHSDAEKLGFKAAVKYVADNTDAPNTCQGHRDHKATACPGDTRYNWVHAGMPVTIPDQKENFLAALTEDEQQEILRGVRAAPKMMVIRRAGSSGMDTVSLACGNTRIPLTSQLAADQFKYVLGQAKASIMPEAMFDALWAI